MPTHTHQQTLNIFPAGALPGQYFSHLRFLSGAFSPLVSSSASETHQLDSDWVLT
uniref:Uncharacterized protein n=1 Tax=Anguilla anguilla TaxID=7936 RepID=A0A0E9TGX4_ANGAN